MGARKGVHPERKTRQVEARRKPDFSDNGDAEAGLRGRHQSGGRRKPNAGGSRREGGFAVMRIESPVVHRPLGVGSRKRQRPQGRSSLRRHKPKADSRSAGVITSTRARRSQRVKARGNVGSKGMPEGRFKTKAQRREPKHRREAGQKAGRKERQETTGASPWSSAGAGRRQEG